MIKPKTEEELTEALESVDFMLETKFYTDTDNGYILLGAFICLHWVLGHNCQAAIGFEGLTKSIDLARGVIIAPPVKGGH